MSRHVTLMRTTLNSSVCTRAWKLLTDSHLFSAEGRDCLILVACVENVFTHLLSNQSERCRHQNLQYQRRCSRRRGMSRWGFRWYGRLSTRQSLPPTGFWARKRLYHAMDSRGRHKDMFHSVWSLHQRRKTCILLLTAQPLVYFTLSTISEGIETPSAGRKYVENQPQCNMAGLSATATLSTKKQ